MQRVKCPKCGNITFDIIASYERKDAEDYEIRCSKCKHKIMIRFSEKIYF